MWILLFVVITFHSVHTRTVNEFVGSTVTFKCPYVQENYNKIVWKGPYGVYAHSNHRNTHLPSDLYNRLFIISNSSVGRFDLKIVNLQYSDEGQYNCSVTNNGTTKSKTFHLSLPVLLQSSEPSYYRYLKLDPSAKKLIVGHMNYVSIVDILDSPRFPVKNNSIEFPSEANKLSYCTLSKEKVPYCQNHIRVLEFRTDDTVILCGTNADSPKGFELNITDNSHISLGPVPCANDPFDNFTTTYITDHNQYGKGIMYYGATLHTEATIFRPMYDGAGRVSEYQKGVISSNWMKDPQFVGSFSLKETVLFFFRETATEVNPSENKIYSRVAKVCKSDIGGNSILRNKWTSYQKARLQCFTEGSSPVYFDDIQDIVEKDGIFYGLFMTRIKSPVSVICAFNTSDIEAVFNGPFKTQKTPNSLWTEAENIPQPRPGMCINNSMAQSEDVLNFIANHPLMHKTIQPLYGKPIFVLYDHLQKLEIHRNMTEIVFYAGSSSGKVYKLFSTNGNTYVSNIFAPSPENEAIWSLVNIGDFVLIGTDYSVRQINVINCEQYMKIAKCIKDPHCAWSDNVCRSAKYISSNSNVNRLQIYTYANFSLTDHFPYMSHPEIPKWLRVIDAFETKLVIEWMSGSSEDESQVFVLEFRKYDEINWSTAYVNETDTQSDLQSFELTGLTEGQIYKIRICAQNSFGRSQFTEILTVSTGHLEDDIEEGLPDRPSQLKVIDVSKTRLIIEWIPGINGETYQIFGLKYTKNDGVDWTSVEIKQMKMSTDPKNITLTGLSECQIYTFHMYVENDVGESYTTENVTVTTDCSGQPVKPQHLRVVQTFKTKCLIAWVPGSRTNLTFIIKLVKKDTSLWQLITLNQIDTTNVINTFELSNLNGCVPYTLQMTAKNYYGESQPTENITFTTDCPHPSEEEEKSVTSQGSHTNENKDVQEYHVPLAIIIILIVPAVIVVVIVYYKYFHKKEYIPEQKTEDTIKSTEKCNTKLMSYTDLENDHGQEEQVKLLDMNGEPSCSVQISKSGDKNSEHKGIAQEKDEPGVRKTTTSQENDSRDQLNETNDQALENQSYSSDKM
ncbi:uncharacterized protein LOC134714904 isoform X2 [Mytilus trossulus]|uniref:uncharacterized protein LOC134714904 isoform X2 n=1 Tax=Mytilus trossulus TaxID=6551 RepID=UPI003005CB69